MTDILVQTGIIGGVGLACSAILSVAARYLAVHEDPRVEQALGMLPGANCGGCGFTGCAEYARGVVLGGAPVNLCSPGGAETVRKLAAFMGVDAAIAQRKVALVLCGGNDEAAARSGTYNGIADCAAADMVAGSGKACRFGCLGFGSCARVCPSGAIEMSCRLATVHPELCISCGKCVAACPRRLIKLVPESAAIHVLCVNTDRGPDVKKVCKVGCIGCSICFKTAGGQGIRMEGALAVVDYANPVSNAETVAKCPQHTIVNRPGARRNAS